MRLDIRLALLALGSCGIINLVGCGSGFNQAAANQPLTSQYTISGHIQLPNGSGSNSARELKPLTALPVSGATVYLYAAGTSGYGSAATLLAMTSTTTTGGGSFNFTQDPNHANSLSNVSSTYSCPSYTFTSANGVSSVSEDSFIYLVSAGGDTQDGSGSAHNNSGAVLMAALGDCQQLALAEPFVDVNPVTTVASAFALQSYISPIYPTAVVNGLTMTLPGGALGTSTAYQTGYGSAPNGGYIAGGANQGSVAIPIGYKGMMNAFNTVPLLVNLASGSANASFQTSSASLGVNVIGTPEQAKINQLANSIAYCIDSSNAGNSLSSQCSTLFALTAPPISSTTTSLGTVTFPAASDTLQATYYMATNPTDNTTNGTPTVGSATNLAKIYNLANAQPDFLPTLTSQPSDWTISIAYTSASTCGTDATTGPFIGPNPWTVATDLNGNVAVINGNGSSTVAQLSPAGVPTLCQLGALANGRTVLYDTAGSIWAQGGVPYLYEGTGAGAPIPWPTTDGTTTFQASAMTADGKGNLFYAASATGTLERFAGAQGSVAPANSQIAGTAIGSTANIYYMVADTLGDIYYPNTSLHNQILEASPVNGGYYTNALVGSTLYYPYGAAVDAANSFISLQDCCSASYSDDTPIRTKATYSTTTGAELTDTNTFGTANIGGLEVPRQVAIDGAGNVWAAMLYASQSYASGGSTLGLWGVSEYTTAFAPLSPNSTTAFSTSVCSTSGGAPATGCNIGGGYSKYSLGEARGIAIDISGNVWVPADLSVNGAANGNLVEIVGAGVPTVQPIAVALRDGKLGAKP